MDIEKSNEKKYLRINLSQLILFFVIFAMIIGGLCYFFVNNTELTKLEKKISTLYLEYETKIADSREQIKDYEIKISELKEKNNELEEYKKANTVNVNGFYTGYYSHDCNMIMDYGESVEWSLPVGNGFEFKEDGSVLAFLPGHEVGYLKGTYEVSNNEINCTFTIFENESSGTYDFPLDKKSVVILKQINGRQLQIKSWDYVSESEESEKIEELYNEGIVFTFYPI